MYVRFQLVFLFQLQTDFEQIRNNLRDLEQDKHRLTQDVGSLTADLNASERRKDEIKSKATEVVKLWVYPSLFMCIHECPYVSMCILSVWYDICNFYNFWKNETCFQHIAHVESLMSLSQMGVWNPKGKATTLIFCSIQSNNVLTYDITKLIISILTYILLSM